MHIIHIDEIHVGDIAPNIHPRHVMLAQIAFPGHRVGRHADGHDLHVKAVLHAVVQLSQLRRGRLAVRAVHIPEPHYGELPVELVIGMERVVGVHHPQIGRRASEQNGIQLVRPLHHRLQLRGIDPWAASGLIIFEHHVHKNRILTNVLAALVLVRHIPYNILEQLPGGCLVQQQVGVFYDGIDRNRNDALVKAFKLGIEERGADEPVLAQVGVVPVVVHIVAVLPKRIRTGRLFGDLHIHIHPLDFREQMVRMTVDDGVRIFMHAVKTKLLLRLHGRQSLLVGLFALGLLLLVGLACLHHP